MLAGFIGEHKNLQILAFLCGKANLNIKATKKTIRSKRMKPMHELFLHIDLMIVYNAQIINLNFLS